MLAFKICFTSVHGDECCNSFSKNVFSLDLIDFASLRYGYLCTPMINWSSLKLNEKLNNFFPQDAPLKKYDDFGTILATKMMQCEHTSVL